MFRQPARLPEPFFAFAGLFHVRTSTRPEGFGRPRKAEQRGLNGGPPPGDRRRRSRRGGLPAGSCPKIWGCGGGWAEFSDRRRGGPFMPQSGRLRSWRPEVRCDTGQSRDSGKGKSGKEGGRKKAKRNRPPPRTGRGALRQTTEKAPPSGGGQSGHRGPCGCSQGGTSAERSAPRPYRGRCPSGGGKSATNSKSYPRRRSRRRFPPARRCPPPSQMYSFQ